ncbi:MAG: DUF4832 domain-containing protein [Deltaproteobacteria bacterium]|nr:DUF4832 domain-containing protein [Deltaproteobacteria bacterium]
MNTTTARILTGAAWCVALASCVSRPAAQGVNDAGQVAMPDAVSPVDVPPAASDAATDSPVDVPPAALDAAMGSDRPAALFTVTYEDDPNTIFSNPERGFYQHTETTASAYAPLVQTALQDLRTRQAVSLVLRLFYLDSFVAADLSQSFLDRMTADFDVIRRAGLKTVLRFAYTSKPTKPYGDATKARVLGHIAQLKPVLWAASDVIAAAEAGFIGAWGEWYYTDNFGDLGTVSASQWNDRREVVTALLGALDLQRPVLLRTPDFKQRFYGAAALTAAQAFEGSDMARVGHHNDCFLASADDQGTYINVTRDKAYLAAETLFLPLGGETCAVSAFSTWTNAFKEMATLHWSFLNQGYEPAVLASWGSNIDIAKRRLGYRLTLVTGAYSTQATQGSDVDVQLSIRNDGFAPPFNARTLTVVLRNASATYLATLPDDPRRFLPGATTSIAHKVCLPENMRVGSYALSLALPDKAPSLSARPEYAIRLANASIWDATTGDNRLGHTLTVQASAGASTCGASAIRALQKP